jgi:hypothetical protein
MEATARDNERRFVTCCGHAKIDANDPKWTLRGARPHCRAGVEEDAELAAGGVAAAT